MVCTFFGHRDAGENIMPQLRHVIEELITKEQVDKFYVGNQGRFDKMVKQILLELSKQYPYISFSVVLAYLPQKKNEWEEENYENSEYPAELAYVPKRYAIDKRNRWMLDKADFVITHVRRTFGGAAKFKALAEKKEKRVINI